MLPVLMNRSTVTSPLTWLPANITPMDAVLVDVDFKVRLPLVVSVSRLAGKFSTPHRLMPCPAVAGMVTSDVIVRLFTLFPVNLLPFNVCAFEHKPFISMEPTTTPALVLLIPATGALIVPATFSVPRFVKLAPVLIVISLTWKLSPTAITG